MAMREAELSENAIPSSSDMPPFSILLKPKIGFDIYPALTCSNSNKLKFAAFIYDLKSEFGLQRLQNGKPVIKMHATYLEFCLGDSPIIPFDCSKFLRFSSIDEGSFNLILNKVCAFAIKHLGTMDLYMWDENFQQSNWNAGCGIFRHQGYWHDREVKNICDRLKEEEEQTMRDEEQSKDEHEDVVLYAIGSTSGRGIGFFAAVNIPRGTRIVSETPLITFESTNDRLTLSKREAKCSYNANFDRAFNSLTGSQLHAYYELHNTHENLDQEAKYGIRDTNVFNLAGEKHGILLTSSRINHSCAPNAEWHWNKLTKRLNVHAIQDIREGEEIFISYLPCDFSYEQRQDNLSDGYGFICRCSLCSLLPEDRMKRDENRAIVDAIIKKIKCCRAIETLDAGMLRELYYRLNEETCMQTDLSFLYAIASVYACCMGDATRAAIFSDKAFQVTNATRGLDNISTAMDRSHSEADPKCSPKYNLFKTEHLFLDDDVPEYCSGKDFDKWLWRHFNGSKTRGQDWKKWSKNLYSSRSREILTIAATASEQTSSLAHYGGKYSVLESLATCF